ncbi:MAG: RNA polymerase factor sigma-54 [Rhodobiaceae bacterium]|nr:RNA polymerase factor sigma-54 [Rhodobiaceae bacterium]
MALTPKLELRQGQALVMTPQLQQAIKLLQLSSLDLSAYVEAELESNPLLERAEDGASGGAGNDDSSAGTGDGEPFAGEGDGSAAGERGEWSQLTFDESAGQTAARLDTDIENVFPDDAGTAGAPRMGHDAAPPRDMDSGWSSIGAGRGGSFEGGAFDMESVLTCEVTLRDHLSEQLALAVGDPAHRLIGRHLIDMVDDAGYLGGDLEALAGRLGAPQELVDETLALLQGFDPPGVFARSLGECLAIQLKEKDRYDPAIKALVDNIELLARREMAKLRQLCGVDEEDFADMVAEIRALDPKPGLKFGSIVVQPIVPDIFVRPHPDGSWQIELNSDALPKVLVNQDYYATVARTARSDADKLYLSDCMQNASWLVKSLDQRARTVLKVAREIVRQQDAFLARGIQYLRPLNLRTVADAISMHESTVSRVTSNKYMATPRGTFELKFFFTSAIAAADGGEAHSAASVRHRIKELIDQESPKAVLSDDQIVQILVADGIDIARRTVAKYREAMRISSSVQRRREKRAMG